VSGPLAGRYDLFVFDLDGVVYIGERPVPGAAPAIARLHEEGALVAYATNNASRRGPQVADVLTRVGVPAQPAEVVTSAQVTAAVLAERLPAGSPVLVVGAAALGAELADVGLKPVSSADDEPVAVVQGYGREVGWALLAEGCVAVRGGATWVATNTDATLPSDRGPLPGNGALVAALATAVGRRPDLVVGKPAPALFVQAARARSARRPLVVGDRLDTDIEGATNAGMHSLVVLTGVTTPTELLGAPPGQRPTYIAADLTGLFDADPDSTGGWRTERASGAVVLRGHGDPVAALRAVCAAVWAEADETVPPIRGDGPAATAALAELGLATGVSGA
jgi:glycerol-1-phosphatase